MRLIFVLFFITFFANAQHTINLKISDKETAHGFSYWNKLAVSSKDTSFVLTLHPLPSNVLSLKSKGEYIFRFHSVFGDVVIKKISISKGHTAVNVSDLTKGFKKESTSKAFLKNLKLRDTVILIHSTFSDVSSSKKLPSYNKILFTKISEKEIIAVQYKDSGNEIVQQMSISDKQYNAIVTAFENKISMLQKKNTCETKEVYTVKNKNKYYSVIDSSCAWKGYDGLLAGLFMAIKP